MRRTLPAALALVGCSLGASAFGLPFSKGPEPPALPALKQLEGKTVTLRLDVVRVKYSLGSANATHVYQNGEVAYRARLGFSMVEFPSAQEFTQALERRFADTKTKILTLAAGSKVTLNRVERDGDDVDVFFPDPGGNEHRIRFARLKEAGAPVDPGTLLAVAFVTGDPASSPVVADASTVVARPAAIATSQAPATSAAAQAQPSGSSTPPAGSASQAQSTRPSAHWKTQLKSALEEYFQPAGEGLLSDRKGYGRTLILRAGGVWGDPDDGNFTPYMTAVRNGKVLGEGGRHDARSRVYVAGEQVLATRIGVGTRDDADYVDINVTSATPVDFLVAGTTKRMRFKASIRFLFAKDRLTGATAKDVAREISPVLQSEDDAKAPKSIGLGQTPDEVRAALGDPERIVDLGAKKMFVYKDMKVIFMDGKVADVQ